MVGATGLVSLPLLLELPPSGLEGRGERREDRGECRLIGSRGGILVEVVPTSNPELGAGLDGKRGTYSWGPAENQKIIVR